MAPLVSSSRGPVEDSLGWRRLPTCALRALTSVACKMCEREPSSAACDASARLSSASAALEAAVALSQNHAEAPESREARIAQLAAETLSVLDALERGALLRLVLTPRCC